MVTQLSRSMASTRAASSSGSTRLSIVAARMRPVIHEYSSSSWRATSPPASMFSVLWSCETTASARVVASRRAGMSFRSMAARAWWMKARPPSYSITTSSSGVLDWTSVCR